MCKICLIDKLIKFTKYKGGETIEVGFIYRRFYLYPFKTSISWKFLIDGCHGRLRTHGLSKSTAYKRSPLSSSQDNEANSTNAFASCYLRVQNFVKEIRTVHFVKYNFKQKNIKLHYKYLIGSATGKS